MWGLHKRKRRRAWPITVTTATPTTSAPEPEPEAELPVRIRIVMETLDAERDGWQTELTKAQDALALTELAVSMEIETTAGTDLDAMEALTDAMESYRRMATYAQTRLDIAERARALALDPTTPRRLRDQATSTDLLISAGLDLPPLPTKER